MIIKNLLSIAASLTTAAIAGASVIIHDLPVSDPAPRAKVDASNSATAAQLEPEILFTEAEIVRSVIEMVQTDPRGALKILNTAVTPQSSAMLDFIIGNLNFQLDERAEALRFYQSAVKKFPNFGKAHKNLGFLALQSEKIDQALNSFVKTVQLGSSEGAVFGLIGYIYLNKENYLSAESAYRDAMLKMPENVDWKLGLGRAVLAHEKHADVMNIMGELLEKEPKKRDYWLVQANAFLSMNRTMDAAYNYEIMGRLGLGSKETYQALGNIYLSQDKPPLALIAYLAAVNLQNPPDMATILGAAELLGGRGALQDSAILSARIAAVFGSKAKKEDNIRLLKLQSQVAIARELQSEAESFLEQLIKLDEDDGQTILLLADFYGRSKRYEKAKPLYEKAEKIEGHEVDALIKHAQILVNEGGYEPAIALLERAADKLGRSGKEEDFTRRANVVRYLESVRRVYRNIRF